MSRYRPAQAALIGKTGVAISCNTPVAAWRNN
jgi:hypothetical protein